MIQNELLELAQSHRLLTDLEPHVLDSLLPLAVVKEYPAGSTVFREDDRSVYLHLIVSGTVALELSVGQGSLAVQTLYGGDAVGWSALTTESRTHFQALALTNVRTVSFRGDELHEACERDPRMGYPLMKGLLALVSDRLDAARLRLVSSYKTAASDGPY